MTLKIEIVMDNAAFHPDGGAEPSRILHELATSLEDTPLTAGHIRPLYDANGNRVGEARVTR